MERILVVEDHRRLAVSIAEGLRDAGYAADYAFDGDEGMRRIHEEPYNAVVLDLMLPGIDGLTILQSLRAAGNRTPVLCLTARDAVDDKIQGLNCGADDYLVKPFEWPELLARVRALIRRSHGHTHDVIDIADLRIDTKLKAVTRGGQPIPLTSREYDLLQLLAFRHDRVITRTEIWEHLYPGGDSAGSNVVDVYIGYLRYKIDRDQPVKLIRTRRGMGYVLTAET